MMRSVLAVFRPVGRLNMHSPIVAWSDGEIFTERSPLRPASEIDYFPYQETAGSYLVYDESFERSGYNSDIYVFARLLIHIQGSMLHSKNFEGGQGIPTFNDVVLKLLAVLDEIKAATSQERPNVLLLEAASNINLAFFWQHFGHQPVTAHNHRMRSLELLTLVPANGSLDDSSLASYISIRKMLPR